MRQIDIAPEISTQQPRAQPLRLLLGLSATALGLLLFSTYLSGNPVEPLTDPIGWLRALDTETAQSIVGNSAELVAAVLAVAVTVVAIVVELAATRYSHELTQLFLRAPLNLMVLSLFVLTTLQCIWTSMIEQPSSLDALIPHAPFALTIAMMTLSLLVLVPYMFFLFAFLTPTSIIDRICRNTYRVIQNTRANRIAQGQARVEEAVDQLQDVARSAILSADRSIAIAAIEAMSNLLNDYALMRPKLVPAWFSITDTIASDPDFLALAPESLAEIEAEGTWLERKILRRFNGLIDQANNSARDAVYLIGIRTQQWLINVGSNDPSMLRLGIRSFNSYLRSTIGARDARSAYYLMHLYRTAATELLRRGDSQSALDISGYLCEYGQWAYKSGLPFLLETAASDLATLIEDAMTIDESIVDPVLDQILELDQEIRDERQESSLLGVRRVQIQLATLFLQRDDAGRAARIINDLRHESIDRLERLREQLATDDRQQFWELTDRGTNFAWLDPARRPFLAQLFEVLRASA